VPDLRLGDRRVDFARREVIDAAGGCTPLTEAEAALLSHLAENAGRAVAREELQARLWGMFGSRVESRAVDMHIARLRGKLGDDGARPTIVLTVRGKGYMLGGPAR
jgi:DNA-binding response OmpR family regulator